MSHLRRNFLAHKHLLVVMLGIACLVMARSSLEARQGKSVSAEQRELLARNVQIAVANAERHLVGRFDTLNRELVNDLLSLIPDSTLREETADQIVDQIVSFVARHSESALTEIIPEFTVIMSENQAQVDRVMAALSTQDELLPISEKVIVFSVLQSIRRLPIAEVEGVAQAEPFMIFMTSQDDLDVATGKNSRECDAPQFQRAATQ